MGHQLHHHHQAVDGLVNLFTKANNDLIIVQNRLEKEFRETYPDNVPPLPSLFANAICCFETI